MRAGTRCAWPTPRRTCWSTARPRSSTVRASAPRTTPPPTAPPPHRPSAVSCASCAPPAASARRRLRAPPLRAPTSAPHFRTPLPRCAPARSTLHAPRSACAGRLAMLAANPTPTLTLTLTRPPRDARGGGLAHLRARPPRERLHPADHGEQSSPVAPSPSPPLPRRRYPAATPPRAALPRSPRSPPWPDERTVTLP